MLSELRTVVLSDKADSALPMNALGIVYVIECEQLC